MLPAAIQAEILRLKYAERWRTSQIARHLGINRKSVQKVAGRRSVALTPAPPAPRTTVVTPFRARIQALLTEDPARSAVTIFQILRQEGYRGGISALRAAVAQRRPAAAPAAVVSLTFGRAEAAQVDWGEFGDVFGLGRAVHAFVLVLCYSRLLTVTFTFSQTLEAFLRGHEQAFAFVGGCPKEVWYDNLATAVAERRGRLVRFHPRFLAYAGHHRFRPVACNVGRGNEKGRVEDAIKYLRTNFWPGRTFRDLADLNAQAQAWRDTLANQREHRVTRKIPSLLVAEERPHLLPLGEPYDTDEVRSVVVPPSFRVAFDDNRYSVPWRLVGKPLTLRADAETVTLWYGTHRVARHARCWRRGIEVILPAHADGLLATKPGAQAHWQVEAVAALGPARARSAPNWTTFCSSPHCTGPPPWKRRSRRASPRRSSGATTWSSGSGSKTPRRSHPRRSPAQRAAGAPEPDALRCVAARRRSGGPPWRPRRLRRSARSSNS